MQYMTFLGAINIPFPHSVHWLFSAVSFAFASITSGALSLDCLMDVNSINLALQRTLWHLGIPVFSLIILIIVQVLWYVSSCPAAMVCTAHCPVVGDIR